MHKPRRPRRRWRLAVIAAAAALLFGALWFELFGLHSRDLRQAVGEWRAAGGKATLREMQPAEVPAERNSALLFHRAFQRIPVLGPEAARALERPWQADDLGPVVALGGESLELAHQAAGRPDCAWPLVFEDGGSTIRRHIQPARAMTGLLVAEAAVRARNDDLAGASDSLAVALRLGDDLLSDPNLLSVSLQRELEGHVLDAYERIYRAREAPPSALEARLARRDYRAEAARMFMAEGAMWLARMSLDTPFDWRDPLSYPYTSSSLRGDTVTYLRSLRGFADYFRRPYYDRRPFNATEPPQWASLLQQLGRNPRQLNGDLALGEARLMLATQAIALRRYKTQRGAYPRELAALGALPADPWTGDPIAYALEGDGFVLRSAAVESDGEPVDWRWEK